jgi:MoxR-like ATPase
MQIVVGQPTYAEELEIARRMGTHPPQADQMLTLPLLVELQNVVDDIFVHHAVQDYAVRLVMATRDPAGWHVPEVAPHIGLGASPRATLGLLAAGRALALLRGRRFLVPQDVADVAPEVLRHRLILTYDALAQGVTTDDVVNRILATMPMPQVTPREGREGDQRAEGAVQDTA